VAGIEDVDGYVFSRGDAGFLGDPLVAEVDGHDGFVALRVVINCNERSLGVKARLCDAFTRHGMRKPRGCVSRVTVLRSPCKRTSRNTQSKMI
jgi:hypothetical protein